MGFMQYERQEEVHYFTFENEGREAVDQWAAQVEQLQLDGKWYGKDIVRLVLDARHSANIPIRYLFECLSDYNREYPHLTPPYVRLAFIHSDNTVVLSIFRSFSEMSSTPMSVEFFSESDHAAALDWVKRNE